MVRRPDPSVAPIGSHRPARASAVLALTLAVVALHGGLIDRLLSSGAGGPAAAPTVATVRALEVLAMRGPAAVRAEPQPGVHPGAKPAAKPAVRPGPHADRRPGPAAGSAAQDAVAEKPADETASRTVAASAAWPAPPRDDAPMPAEPPPVYATRLPATTSLRYALQRGDARGTATLDWKPDGAGYELVLQARLPKGATLEQRSQGGFDEAGLAPMRLADRRQGRTAQAVNFQRPQGRITFSGPRWEFPLVPGVQDRLSWMVQLVAIAAAAPLAAGDEVALQVVGARGATSRWRFRVEADKSAADGVVHLVREPEHLYDLRLELWLDPAHGSWPVRMRQAQVPGGEALEWMLDDGPTPRGGT